MRVRVVWAAPNGRGAEAAALGIGQTEVMTRIVPGLCSEAAELWCGPAPHAIAAAEAWPKARAAIEAGQIGRHDDDYDELH